MNRNTVIALIAISAPAALAQQQSIKLYGTGNNTYVDALNFADGTGAGLSVAPTVANPTTWIFTYEGRTLKLLSGSRTAYLDGKKITLNAPPAKVQGKVMMPYWDLVRKLNVKPLIEQANQAQREAAELVRPKGDNGTFSFDDMKKPSSFTTEDKRNTIENPDEVTSWDINRQAKADELVATCRKGVKRRLKAPATAQFNEDPEFIARYTDGMYLMSDSVDSQNGYGALIRTNFYCTAVENGKLVYTRIIFRD